ncbi:MAG: universal stress protein [Planctomycetota bacterium]
MTQTTIVLATDFSQEAQRAYGPTVDMAERLGGKIVLAHVVEAALISPHGAPLAPAQVAPDTPQRVDEAEEQLKKEAQLLGDRVPVEVKASSHETCAEGLVRLADGVGATHIAISTHGRTGLRRLVLGSVAEGVVRYATVPVICYPAH